MSAAERTPLLIWRFTDGRRGHDAQSRGLALAIAAIRPTATHDVAVAGAFRSATEFLAGRFDAGRGLPDPELLIGAGHGTHLPLLAARRARGGRIVVLMRPSLPAACFDLCLIPDHDGVPVGGRVILTRGPLNAIRPRAERGGGLILVGGTSRHYAWPEAALLDQIRTVLATPGPWALADSPRTPDSTRARLRAMSGVRYLPWEQGGANTLQEALGGAARVWVTADSVSMIHEALSSGAAVGVLELPSARPKDRVVAALQRLRAERLVTVFGDWQPGTDLRPPDEVLSEASRCAELVLQRLC